MTFTMIYHERNIKNLEQLADITKVKAVQWYQYCYDNKIQVLVYETIRTKEKQLENVRAGKSRTMESWHLTGQALDWVLVDNNGNTLWDGYKTSIGLKVINEAKRIGFTSGYDWGWDSPHLQYDKVAYGKDAWKSKGIKIVMVGEKEKEVELLNYSSPTLKKKYDDRLASPTTHALLDSLAVEVLGHTSKIKDGKLADGDLSAIAIELAVSLGKKHNESKGK